MNRVLLLLAAVLILSSCDKEEERVFERSADERVAAAIDSLQQKLVSAPNGWIVRYRPVQESGSFNILLTFNEENNVNIRTDYGDGDQEFYNQTVTYRIDNSLGLELILESYTFFSYLFEQNRATYGGEFEFNYINETNGALVFNSKSDVTIPTILVFQPAEANSADRLGTQLSQNLNTLSDNLLSATSVYKLSYTDKDLAFYLSFDNFQRVINFTYAAPKNGVAGGRALDFSTPYTIQGDSMVFDNPLEGNFMGNSIAIPGIRFGALTDGALDLCGQAQQAKEYAISLTGSSAQLQSTLFDPLGATLKDDQQLFISYIPGGYITQNGVSAADQLTNDIEGITFLVLINRSDTLMEIGYYAPQADGTLLWEMREFNPVFQDNIMTFNFSDTYNSYGDTTSLENQAAMNVYLEALAQGNATRILKPAEGFYELYNPCSGWSFVIYENG